MTSEEIRGHLERRLPSRTVTGAPEALLGGLLNHVWRVPAKPEPVIVKHAPPHLASAPEVLLDPSRLLIEAGCLETLGPEGVLADIATEAVRPPRLLDLDGDRKVLVMEDVGRGPDLGAWLRAGHSAEQAGAALGTFIGRLHAASAGRQDLAVRFDNHAMQQARHAMQYQAIGGLLEKAGVADADALGAEAVALGQRFLEPGVCLTMGDLWPSSVLVTDDGLRVIDWELAHYGNPAQDLGHLAAHLWMHAHRAPNAAVRSEVDATLDGFLRAYRTVPGTAALLTPDVLRDATLHAGCEILVRIVGGFQEGYLYRGLSSGAASIREAIAEAVRCLRLPEQHALFATLA